MSAAAEFFLDASELSDDQLKACVTEARQRGLVHGVDVRPRPAVFDFDERERVHEAHGFLVSGLYVHAERILSDVLRVWRAHDAHQGAEP